MTHCDTRCDTHAVTLTLTLYNVPSCTPPLSILWIFAAWPDTHVILVSVTAVTLHTASPNFTFNESAVLPNPLP